MPLPIIPVPPYPDVPVAPGVPPVPRQTGSAAAPIDPLRQDGPTVANGPQGVRWGIYDQDSVQVLVPDSFVGVEYRKDWRIVDYPVENGGFESYNKVAQPYDARVTVAKGGTDGERAVFLEQLEVLGASLDLFNIATPERTYLNCNITIIDYRRTARAGATLLSVEIGFREVRETVTVAYSNVKVPSAADPVNDGAVQPRALTPDESAALVALPQE